MIERFIAWLSKVLKWEAQLPPEVPQKPETAPASPVPPVVVESTVTKPKTSPMTNQERLYSVAYASLGKDMRADKSVPIELGCASSMSGVLKLAGVKTLPAKGIPGTAQLFSWLKLSPQFSQIKTPGVGDIVIYPTGYDDPQIPGLPKLQNGHVFVKGKFQLLSNNSATGKWDNHWDSLEKADAYYTRYGGIPRYSFQYVG